MKRFVYALAISAVAANLSPAATVLMTNATSAVELRGWRRTYVYGLGDGRLIDPSGRVADGVAAQALMAAQTNMGAVVAAAQASATAQVARVYAVTNEIANFTKRIFVQVHLRPDLTSPSNLWGYVAREWTDGETDHAWVYFSRELEIPPVVKRTYRGELATNTVEGAWTDFRNGRETVNGYEGCRELTFERPEEFRGKVTFRNPHVGMGSALAGFDFGNVAFTVDGGHFFTGAFTNANGKIHRWVNGVRTGGENEAR